RLRPPPPRVARSLRRRPRTARTVRRVPDSRLPRQERRRARGGAHVLLAPSRIFYRAGGRRRAAGRQGRGSRHRGALRPRRLLLRHGPGGSRDPTPPAGHGSHPGPPQTPDPGPGLSAPPAQPGIGWWVVGGEWWVVSGEWWVVGRSR